MEDNFDYRQATMSADAYAAALAYDSVEDIARNLIETNPEQVLSTEPTTDPYIILARQLYHTSKS